MLENDLPISSGVIEELYRRFAKLGQDWNQRG